MIPELRQHFFFEPKPQELFSSWLLRLCAKAHLSPHGFGIGWFGSREIWTRDIDRRVWPEEAILFAAKIGVNPHAVLQSCLSFRMGWNVSSAPGFTPGLLALGIYHRLHQRHGLVFCPECMAEDDDPYYRMGGRLATQLICKRHEVLMQDACARCDAPISPHRAVQIGIHRCHACGNDLRTQGVARLSEPMPASYLSVQEKLSADTDNSIHERRVILSKVRLCWRLLLDRRTASKFQRAATAAGLSLPINSADRWHQLEYSRIKLRQRWLPIVAMVMEEWPNRMQVICQQSGLTQRMILESVQPARDGVWVSVLIEPLKPSPERKPRKAKRSKRKLPHKKAFDRVGLAAAVQMQFPDMEGVLDFV